MTSEIVDPLLFSESQIDFLTMDSKINKLNMELLKYSICPLGILNDKNTTIEALCCNMGGDISLLDSTWLNQNKIINESRETKGTKRTYKYWY